MIRTTGVKAAIAAEGSLMLNGSARPEPDIHDRLFAALSAANSHRTGLRAIVNRTCREP